MSYSKGWLNYILQKEPSQYEGWKIKTLDPSRVTRNAVKELEIAFKNLWALDLLEEEINHKASMLEEKHCFYCLLSNQMEHLSEKVSKKLQSKEGFQILDYNDSIYIIGTTPIGIMYGVFHCIRMLMCNERLEGIHVVVNPSTNLRMINHWDNVDGSIERGYAGQSIFFKNNKLCISERIYDYARLLASIGINGVVINNVNVREKATALITNEYLGSLKTLAELFEGYGIGLFLSVNFAAPMELGNLDSADPLDDEVCKWWSKTVSNLYEGIPNFGGFLVKADSEFRPGPFTYGRTHAEGANMLARALQPHGGILIWRCFVYNCQQDWRDKTTDRARAAYDHFIHLDGEFDENVILQIKNGPIDFQVREPVSPLFGGLKNTNQMLEVQITQEYTGQQKHVCYLVPMWKEVLEFETYVDQELGKVKNIVAGQTFGQKTCGIAAVTNIGDDDNWTGHDLAAANLYGYGRLCFQFDLSSKEIVKEWIQMTYHCTDKVEAILEEILMNSWKTYEKYTAPLGIGFMVNPNHHYGPNVDGYEYSKWGTYHRADHKGLGVDRTSKGTGYVNQYHENNAMMYENIETCPQELLLFFHYINYKDCLKDGRTLIQYIYDTHFEGVEEVEHMIAQFESIKGEIEENAYERILERLLIQLKDAKEWRDVINTYFYRKSGIPDKYGRVIYS